MDDMADARHSGKELMKFSPLRERESEEKSSEEKLNWASLGSGEPRLKKCNKAAQRLLIENQ